MTKEQMGRMALEAIARVARLGRWGELVNDRDDAVAEIEAIAKAAGVTFPPGAVRHAYSTGEATHETCASCAATDHPADGVLSDDVTIDDVRRTMAADGFGGAR